MKLTIEYDNAETAENILRAVEPDNDGHLRSELNGNVITFTMGSDNAGTLRNTADDLLACIRIAEDASGLVPGAVPDLDGDSLLE